MHGGHMVGNMYITKWLRLVLRIPYTELQIHQSTVIPIRSTVKVYNTIQFKKYISCTFWSARHYILDLNCAAWSLGVCYFKTSFTVYL